MNMRGLRRLWRGNWWDQGGRARPPRCDHAWTGRTIATRTVLGREAQITTGVCGKCGVIETLMTQWVDCEGSWQAPVTVTFTRREYEAVLRSLPDRSVRAYGSDAADLLDARDRMEAAARQGRAA